MSFRRAFALPLALGIFLAAGGVASGAWTQLGDYGISAGLAGPRGAAVAFVGTSLDGASLIAVTATGRAWTSGDHDSSWQPLETLNPALLFRPERADAASAMLDAVVARHPYRAGWQYALGADLHLSKDGGATWTALTNEAVQPMIGANPTAIAFDPADPERLFVSTDAGLWRSSDSGLSWVSLNAALPNFPAGRFRELAPGAPPLFEADGVGPSFLPGGARRWIAGNGPVVAPAASKSATFANFLDAGSIELPAPKQEPGLTTLAISGGAEPLRMAGTADGKLWLSSDTGRSWRLAGKGLPDGDGRRIADLWLDPASPLAAIAVFSGRQGGRVFRTVDGGDGWDDLTADLPPGEIRSVAASADGDALYVGGEAGVYYASVSLRTPSSAANWEAVSDDLPAAAVNDLYLSARTGRLYVAVDGFGVYRRRAPDVLRSMRLLNAADLSGGAIAPGGLLTLLGAAVESATINGLPAPVLFSTPEESQIQAPFQTRPNANATVELATSQGARTLSFPIAPLAPAIFVDEGEPLVVDAGSGRLLDLTRPGRPGMRVLILAAGLGAVDPVWPTGLAAPLENAPTVVAPVRAYLDGAPLEVLNATLAGGYVGAYWVEAELPISFQGGSGSLVIEAGGGRSNAVGLLLAP